MFALQDQLQMAGIYMPALMKSSMTKAKHLWCVRKEKFSHKSIPCYADTDDNTAKNVRLRLQLPSSCL